MELSRSACPTLCNTMDWSLEACQASLSITIPELTQTHIHQVHDGSNHLILGGPLLLLPSIFPSIRVFSNDSVLCIRWPNIGLSASASVLPMNIQDLLPLGWTGWVSLLSKGLSRVFPNTTVQKHQFFDTQPSLWSNCYMYAWLLKKALALTIWTFAGKVLSQLLNTLSRWS